LAPGGSIFWKRTGWPTQPVFLCHGNSSCHWYVVFSAAVKAPLKPAHSKRFAYFKDRCMTRSVLGGGSPLPLFHQTVSCQWQRPLTAYPAK
jgi:hypothetical protein